MNQKKAGLFDSDGYIVLEAEYNDTDFYKEIQRLENIACIYL